MTNPRCRRRWWTSLSTTLFFASRKFAVHVFLPQLCLCLHLESSSFTPGRKEWKSSRGKQTPWRCWLPFAGRRTNSRSPRRDSLHTPCWLWSGDSSDPEVRRHSHHLVDEEPGGRQTSLLASQATRSFIIWELAGWSFILTAAVSILVVGEITKSAHADSNITFSQKLAWTQYLLLFTLTCWSPNALFLFNRRHLICNCLRRTRILWLLKLQWVYIWREPLLCTLDVYILALQVL